MIRRTVRNSVSGSGVGVHCGTPCEAEIRRAAFGDGLCVEVGGVRVAVHVDRVVPVAGATVLQVGDHRVSTVEHVLAALIGAGVTDAIVVVTGGEVPILDGSADIWWHGIAGAGTIDGPPIEELVVTDVIEVAHGGGVARWSPCDRCEVAVEVDYGVFAGAASVVIPGPDFAAISAARTFAMGADLDFLRSAGRGKGATLADTVIWDAAGPRNPLRMFDEPVRHKLLDVVGDLALVGRPVRGRLDVERGSHALHHAAVRRLLETTPVSTR